jgi:hypothetical protein
MSDEHLCFLAVVLFMFAMLTLAIGIGGDDE